ncbi:MAG: hypothetical protein KME10_05155 [Plectolyngbya sp. WJT66-NPBG17]|jgi:uncharacterized protein YgiM (DUF1202 family)|nr:hypothetical protein [Plectolyngbya sp. WJT66-NPBG17]
METVTYTKSAIIFKTSKLVRLARSLKKLCLSIPSSAWVGCAGLMLAASILVTHVPSAQAAQVVRVSSNVSALNVRNGPGVGYGLNGRPLYPGETVRVVRESGGWYQLPDGGWFSATYTTSGSSGGIGGGGTPVSRTVRATTTVNVRNGPGAGYSLNGRPLYPGETVRVVRESGGWYQLPDGGWFSAAYTTSGSSGGIGGGGYASAVVSTNGSNLVIRSSPTGGAIGSLSNGTVVRLSGQTSAGYAQLSSGGWVSRSWIR